jgi:transcriptional regulator with XRE-family HTH domain
MLSSHQLLRGQVRSDRSEMGDVGKRVRDRRIALGLSVSETARRSGISRPYVHKIENAMEDRPIAADKLFQLSRALETTPAWLLGIDPDEAPLPLPPDVLAYFKTRDSDPRFGALYAFAALGGVQGHTLTRDEWAVVVQALLDRLFGAAPSGEARRAARRLAESMVDQALADDEKERSHRIGEKLIGMLARIPYEAPQFFPQFARREDESEEDE